MRNFFLATLALAACSQETTESPPAPEPQQTEVSAIASTNVALMRATPTGPGETVGTVTIRNSVEGVVFELDLTGLPAGTHGFHVHQIANCGPAHENGQPMPAGAAGGHFDPQNTGRHAGPEGNGHLGDLPRIEIGPDGRPVQQRLSARRISDVAQLSGHALMIHEGGDNYTDQLAPLGGGGARIACGVIG
jgi:superoxide dismutase, Cu-Zn family